MFKKQISSSGSRSNRAVGQLLLHRENKRKHWDSNRQHCNVPVQIPIISSLFCKLKCNLSGSIVVCALAERERKRKERKRWRRALRTTSTRPFLRLPPTGCAIHFGFPPPHSPVSFKKIASALVQRISYLEAAAKDEAHDERAFCTANPNMTPNSPRPTLSQPRQFARRRRRSRPSSTPRTRRPRRRSASSRTAAMIT